MDIIWEQLAFGGCCKLYTAMEIQFSRCDGMDHQPSDYESDFEKGQTL